MPLYNVDPALEDALNYGPNDQVAAYNQTATAGRAATPQSVIPWEQFSSGSWAPPAGYTPITDSTGRIIGYMPSGGAGSATAQQPVYLIGNEPAPDGGFGFGDLGDVFSDPLALLNPGTYLQGASTGATGAALTGNDIGEGAQLGGDASVIGGGLLSLAALPGLLSTTAPELTSGLGVTGADYLGPLGGVTASGTGVGALDYLGPLGGVVDNSGFDFGDLISLGGGGSILGNLGNILDDAGLDDLFGGTGGSAGGINPAWSLVGGLLGMLGDGETSVNQHNVTTPIASPLLTGTDPQSLAFQQALTNQLNAPDISANPYFQPTLDAAFQPVIRDFMTQILPNIRGQAVTANGVGSSRHGIAEAQSVDALTRNLLNTGAQAAYQFNQAGMGTQGQALDRLLRASGGTGTDQTQSTVTQLDPVTQFLSGLTGSLGLISEYNRLANPQQPVNPQPGGP